MAEKKKQVSIAAFFSPRAKSSAAKSSTTPTPVVVTAVAAPSAPVADVSVDAAPAPEKQPAVDAASPKKQRKSPRSAAATRAKRPRASSSAGPAATVAAATDGTSDQPADLRSPPSLESAAPTPPLAEQAASAAVVDVSASLSPSDSGKRTIIKLLATPPPPKRAKKSSDAEPDAAAEDEGRAAAATGGANDPQPVDSDGILSGDEADDSGWGPHVEPPKAKRPVGRPRGRKPSPKAADAPSSDAAAAPKLRGRPPGSKAKGAATTPLKKQPARAGKEKPAAAALAAEQKPLPPPPLPAPAPVALDPLVKARVDTYQQKIDELTQQCTHLLQAPSATDGILQEIYGLALDVGLELGDDSGHDATTGALAQSVAELFRSHLAPSGSEPDAPVTELSADLKGFVARSVQGRSSSLSSLSQRLLQTLSAMTTKDSGGDSDSAAAAAVVAGAVSARVLVRLEMEIKMLAQRTNYGVRPAKANLFEDTSAAALWIWEVGSLDKYFGDEAHKTIKRMRKNRKRLGLQLKSLARVVQLLLQSPLDEVKVSAEEAKVSRFVLATEAETLKAQDRERKELEKTQLAEQKKQHELDRELAKHEEKRKRDEEGEAERALAHKRKKSLVSYFRSIDSSSNTASAGGGGGAVAADGAGSSAASGEPASGSMSQADRRKARRESAQNAVMARMDAAVAYLVGCGDTAVVAVVGVAAADPETAALSAASDATKSAQQVRTHVQGERKSAARVAAASGFWGSRRRRDPALGVMKLLQFHENHRPAYFGTFSAKSRVFRGGRRPLAQYAKFEYAVDSEEEWEEEEPGESLSDADSEVEDSDDDLDYGDQWLAYEDEVDYMDGAEDDEPKDGGGSGSYVASPERSKHKRVPEQKKRTGRKKGAKPLKLEPQIVGPFCFEDAAAATEAAAQLSAYTGELLRTPQFESAMMRKAREYDEEKERLRVLQELQQQQAVALEQQALGATAAAEAAAETASSQGAAAPKPPVATKATPTKTPTKVVAKTPMKTPQKRKLSTENVTSPQKPTAAAGSTALSQTSKAGIAAWLKKPQAGAVVDLSSQDETDAAPAVTAAVDGAVVDLINQESDTSAAK
ncbi:hypothetical protein PybrP1_003248 [[Pythium] brassicae (nom. inval.)]|nr:hypothetical protein PybrP1_003248 [[Pythium] brassicae (nom. inval.)]